ncbi:MAG: hypothetical protein Q9181_002937 [Wetmoreana brouardii]
MTSPTGVNFTPDGQYSGKDLPSETPYGTQENVAGSGTSNDTAANDKNKDTATSVQGGPSQSAGNSGLSGLSQPMGYFQPSQSGQLPGLFQNTGNSQSTGASQPYGAARTREIVQPRGASRPRGTPRPTGVTGPSQPAGGSQPSQSAGGSQSTGGPNLDGGPQSTEGSQRWGHFSFAPTANSSFGSEVEINALKELIKQKDLEINVANGNANLLRKNIDEERKKTQLEIIEKSKDYDRVWKELTDLKSKTESEKDIDRIRLDEENAQLRKDYEDLEEKRAAHHGWAENVIDELVHDKDDLEREINDWKRKHEAAERVKGEAEGAIEEYRGSLAAKDQEIVELKKTQHAAEGKFKQSERTVREQNIKIKAQDATINDRKEKIDGLKENIKNLTNQIKEQKMELAEAAELFNGTGTESHANLKKQIQRLKSDHEKVCVELQKEKDARQKSGEEAQQVNQEYSILKQGYDGIVKDVDMLRRANEELTQERDDLKQEGQKLSQQSDDLTRHRDILSRQKDALTKERDELKQERDELQRERDDLKEKRGGLIKARHNLGQERDDLNQERDQLKQERDELQQERDDLKEKRDGIINARDNLEQERDQLKQEQDDLMQLRDDLRHELESCKQDARVKPEATEEKRITEPFAKDHASDHGDEDQTSTAEQNSPLSDPASFSPIAANQSKEDLSQFSPILPPDSSPQLHADGGQYSQSVSTEDNEFHHTSNQAPALTISSPITITNIRPSSSIPPAGLGISGPSTSLDSERDNDVQGPVLTFNDEGIVRYPQRLKFSISEPQTTIDSKPIEVQASTQSIQKMTGPSTVFDIKHDDGAQALVFTSRGGDFTKSSQSPKLSLSTPQTMIDMEPVDAPTFQFSAPAVKKTDEPYTSLDIKPEGGAQHPSLTSSDERFKRDPQGPKLSIGKTLTMINIEPHDAPTASTFAQPIKQVASRKMSPMWRLFWFLLLLLASAILLIAASYGESARRERKMWLAANDFSRRAVISIRSGGGSGTGIPAWLWNDQLLEHSTYYYG